MILTQNYVMKSGDNSRRIRVILKENNALLSAQPDSVKLRIQINYGVVERDMSLVSGGWEYHITDSDFTAFGTGTFKAEFKATFGSELLTYPTKSAANVTIIPTLSGGSVGGAALAVDWGIESDMASLQAIPGSIGKKGRIVTDTAAPHNIWYYVHGDDVANADGVNVVRGNDNLGNWYAVIV